MIGIRSWAECMPEPGCCSGARVAVKERWRRLAFHAGERLVEKLAPELAPMLTALEMPANFVPVTNAVLSEMARRGVSRWSCHPQPDST